jgi:hypothetical protein
VGEEYLGLGEAGVGSALRVTARIEATRPLDHVAVLDVDEIDTCTRVHFMQTCVRLRHFMQRCVRPMRSTQCRERIHHFMLCRITPAIQWSSVVIRVSSSVRTIPPPLDVVPPPLDVASRRRMCANIDVGKDGSGWQEKG